MDRRGARIVRGARWWPDRGLRDQSADDRTVQRPSCRGIAHAERHARPCDGPAGRLTDISRTHCAPDDPRAVGGTERAADILARAGGAPGPGIRRVLWG